VSKAKPKPYKPPKIPKKSGDEKLFGGQPIGRVAYKGVLDWDKVYSYVREWFSERKYDFDEYDYKHKEGTKYGIEEEFKWKAKRKIDDYYRYKITVEVHNWDMRRVEVIEKGQKKKLWKGRVLMEFYAEVETDYQGVWKRGPFALELKKFVDQFINKPERKAVYTDRLLYMVQRLQGRVREIMNMEAKKNAHEIRW
jgi:hypothetical protein